MQGKIGEPEIKHARNICFYFEILFRDLSRFVAEVFGGKLFRGFFCI